MFFNFLTVLKSHQFLDFFKRHIQYFFIVRSYNTFVANLKAKRAQNASKGLASFLNVTIIKIARLSTGQGHQVVKIIKGKVTYSFLVDGVWKRSFR